METGWLKLYRNLLNKAIWTTSTPEQKTILITLLLLAEQRDKEWEWKKERITIKAGQLITSQQELAKITGTTRQIVRTALNKFERYEFLTQESTNKETLITLVNWRVYQSQPPKTNQQTNQRLTNYQPANNQRLTSKQPTTNQHLTNEQPAPNQPDLCNPLPAQDSPPLRIKEDDEDDDIGKNLANIYKNEVDVDLIRYINSISEAFKAIDKQKYMAKIINNCIAEGITTKAAYLANEKAKNNSNKKKYTPAKNEKKTKFFNFSERDDIDFAEMRRLENERIDKLLAEPDLDNTHLGNLQHNKNSKE